MKSLVSIVLAAVIGLAATPVYADDVTVVRGDPDLIFFRTTIPRSVKDITITAFKQNGRELDLAQRLEAGREISRALLNEQRSELKTHFGFDAAIEQYEEVRRLASAQWYGATYEYKRQLNGLKVNNGGISVTISTDGAIKVIGEYVVCSSAMLEATKAPRKSEAELQTVMEGKLKRTAEFARHPVTGQFGELEIVVAEQPPYVVGVFRLGRFVYHLDARTGEMLPQDWGW